MYFETYSVGFITCTLLGRRQNSIVGTVSEEAATDRSNSFFESLHLMEKYNNAGESTCQQGSSRQATFVDRGSFQ